MVGRLELFKMVGHLELFLKMVGADGRLAIFVRDGTIASKLVTGRLFCFGNYLWVTVTDGVGGRNYFKVTVTDGGGVGN